MFFHFNRRVRINRRVRKGTLRTHKLVKQLKTINFINRRVRGEAQRIPPYAA